MNRLWVDGTLALQWHMQPAREPLDLPPSLDGAPWRGGFLRWADEHLEPDAAEQACILRRACDIGMGRGMDLDGVPVADQLPTAFDRVRSGAGSTVTRLQTMPDSGLRLLAAASIGLGAGLRLAGAPRLAILAGFASASVLGFAIVSRPNRVHLTHAARP